MKYQNKNRRLHLEGNGYGTLDCLHVLQRCIIASLFNCFGVGDPGFKSTKMANILLYHLLRTSLAQLKCCVLFLHIALQISQWLTSVKVVACNIINKGATTWYERIVLFRCMEVSVFKRQ